MSSGDDSIMGNQSSTKKKEQPKNSSLLEQRASTSSTPSQGIQNDSTLTRDRQFLPSLGSQRGLYDPWMVKPAISPERDGNIGKYRENLPLPGPSQTSDQKLSQTTASKSFNLFTQPQSASNEGQKRIEQTTPKKQSPPPPIPLPRTTRTSGRPQPPLTDVAFFRPLPIVSSPIKPPVLSPVINKENGSMTGSKLTPKNCGGESLSSHSGHDLIDEGRTLKGEFPDVVEQSKTIRSPSFSTRPSSVELSPGSLSESPLPEFSDTESTIAQRASPQRNLTPGKPDADKATLKDKLLLDSAKLVLNVLKPAKTLEKKEPSNVSFYIPRKRLPPPTAKGTKLTTKKPHTRITSKAGASKLSFNRVNMRFLIQLRQKWTNIQSLYDLQDLLDLLDLDNVVLVNLKILQFRHHFTGLVSNMDNFTDCSSLFKVLAVVATSKFEYTKLDVMKEIASKEFVSKLDSLINLVSLHPPTPSELNVFLHNLVTIYGNLFMQLDTLVKEDFVSNLETLLQKCLLLLDDCNDTEQSEIADDMKGLLTIISAKDVLIRADSCYPFNILQEESVESNIIEGPFDSFDQYLSIHYRLLKEDFQDSLRVGIGDYLKTLHGRKRRSVFDHLYVYHEVTLSIELTDLRLKYKITFTRPSEIDKVQGNKAFCNGSLLILTYPDKPFAEYFLVKVEDSSPLDNKKKFIFVSIVLGPPDLMLKEHHGLLLVEPARFFEPYYRVLQVIRSIEGNNFPFIRYLVDVRTDIYPPYYVDQDTVLKIDGYSVPLWDDDAWPHPEEIGLNLLQLEGLKLALRSELAIIQGPPGTGKTYLSWKIIEVLLQNKNLWHNQSCDGAGMILVVCYKNQSLDQLLGSLLKKKRKVVRLGLQSKDENLDEYNLRTLDNPKCTPYYYQMRRSLKEEQGSYVDALTHALGTLKNIDSYDGLIKVDLLFTVIPLLEDDLNFLQRDLDKWLLNCSSDEFCDVRSVQSLLAESTSNWAEAVEEEMKVESDFTHLTFHDLNELLARVNTKAVALNELDSGAEDYIAKLASAVKFLNEKHDLLNSLMRFVSQPMTEKEWSHIDEINKSVASSDSVLQNLQTNDRWLLYKGWVSDLRKFTVSRINWLENRMQECLMRNFELQEMQDLEKLAQCDAEVIGMTTTAAAKNYKILHYLKPRIVLVEEAAEVVEAHTIAALSEHTAHLILVGDHKQLRPMTSSHLIGRDAHLDISMYERLVKNKLPHCTLNTQYRMRPEISALISPSVYPELMNHDSVLQLPNVLGIKKNLFFVDHAATENKTVGMPSVWNEYEAEFHMALCDYLLKQGYLPSQITVLATYAEQERYFTREKDKFPSLQEVQFATVDSFQGKENDIILLSLVRSNSVGQVGFVGMKNRINVALSRARIGLFITGNSNSLAMKNGLWPEVLNLLKSSNSIGRSIPLKCQIHGKITELAKPQDFSKVANGGCSRICNETLSCKHKCMQQCHPVDREHVKIFKCLTPCGKPMLCSHTCDRNCHYLDEGKKCLCLRCSAGVKCNEMLLCGHQCEAVAHVEDPDHLHKYQCNKICDTTLKCGHVCRSMCHTEDREHQKNYKCPISCEGTLLCGHPCQTKTTQKHECFTHTKTCCKLCDKKLTCGHKCNRFAHLEDRLHKDLFAKCIKCTHDKMPVEIKTHSISHFIEPPCSPPAHQNPILPSETAKMSKDATILNELCREVLKCSHRCDRKVGHEFDRDHAELCIKPCGKKLNCDHLCRKACHPGIKCQDYETDCDTCKVPKPAVVKKVEKAISKQKKGKCHFAFSCGYHKCLKKKHCEDSQQHDPICRYMRTITFRCGHSASFRCTIALLLEKEESCDSCKSTVGQSPATCGFKFEACKHLCQKPAGHKKSHKNCKQKCPVNMKCGHAEKVSCWRIARMDKTRCSNCTQRKSKSNGPQQSTVCSNQIVKPWMPSEGAMSPLLKYMSQVIVKDVQGVQAPVNRCRHGPLPPLGLCLRQCEAVYKCQHACPLVCGHSGDSGHLGGCLNCIATGKASPFLTVRNEHPAPSAPPVGVPRDRCDATFSCGHACQSSCKDSNYPKHSSLCPRCENEKCKSKDIGIEATKLASVQKSDSTVYCHHGELISACCLPCPIFFRCGHVCKLVWSSMPLHTCSDHSADGNYCPFQCDKLLPCGHHCQKPCHQRLFRASLSDFRHLCEFNCDCCNDLDENQVVRLTSVRTDVPCRGMHELADYCIKQCALTYSCGHTNYIECNDISYLTYASRSVECTFPCTQGCNNLLAEKLEHFDLIHPTKGLIRVLSKGRGESTESKKAQADQGPSQSDVETSKKPDDSTMDGDILQNTDNNKCFHQYPCSHTCEKIVGHKGGHGTCPYMCGKKLPCGHNCIRKCHSMKNANVHVCEEACALNDDSSSDASSAVNP